MRKDSVISASIALLLTGFLVITWIACNKLSPTQSGQNTGSLILTVRFPESVSTQNKNAISNDGSDGQMTTAQLNKEAATISSVIITVSASDMQSIVKEIEIPANTFSVDARITGIPAGNNRKVDLKLTENDSTVRYQGETIVNIRKDQETAATILLNGLGVNIRNFHPGDEVTDYLIHLRGIVSDVAEDSMVSVSVNGLAFPPARVNNNGGFDAWVAVQTGVNQVLVQDSKGRSDQIELKGKVEAAGMLAFLVWAEQNNRRLNLHIQEPNGDHCYIGNETTARGGQLNYFQFGPTEGPQYRSQYYRVSGTDLQSGIYTLSANYSNKSSVAEVDAYLYIYLGSNAVQGPGRLLGPHRFVYAARQDSDDGSEPDAWWTSASLSMPDGRFISTPTGPAEPILAMPESGAVCYGDTVQFAWSRVSTARGYQIQISEPDQPLSNAAYPAPAGSDSNRYVAMYVQNGSYEWRVRSLDAGGNSGAWSRTFKFNLTRNRLPQWIQVPDTVIYTQEEKVVHVPIKAVDADAADLLSLSIENRPHFLSISDLGGGSGSLALTPTQGDGSKGATAGRYQDIRLRVTDNGTPALSTVYVFSIVVAAKQTAPELVDINSFSMYEAEDTPKQIPVFALDPNGDALILTAENLPSFASFQPDGGGKGVLSFYPGYSDSGRYTINLIAMDNGQPVMTDTTTFVLTVLNKNRLPVVVHPGNQESKEGATLAPGLHIQAQDPDGDDLSYTAEGVPLQLQIDQQGWISGIISANTPALNPYLVKVKISDGQGEVVVEFKWTITGEKPVIINPGDQNSAEGEQISWQIQATDPNADDMIYAAENLPAGLTLNSLTGQVHGPIDADAAKNSPYKVTIRVQDKSDRAWQSSASFEWHVYNPGPRWTHPGAQVNDEADQVRLQLYAADDDFNLLRYALKNGSILPDDLALDPITGLISGPLDYEAAGSYNITVTVTDQDSIKETSFVWTIRNTNRPPYFSPAPGNQVSNEGATPQLQIHAEDYDGDRDLTYRAYGLPGQLFINSQTGWISGGLDYATGGGQPYPVRLTVSDGTDSSSTSFIWTVTDVNRPPMVVNPGTLNNAENDSIDVQIMAGDVDDDSISFSYTGLLAMGLNFDAASGKIWGKLNYNLATRTNPQKRFPITITVTDAKGEQTKIQFDWWVQHTNRAPVITQIDSLSNKSNDPVNRQIIATDPDGDSLVDYEAIYLPDGITLNPSTGKLEGQIGLQAWQASPYSVSIYVKDEKGLQSEPMTFTWYVSQ